MLKRIVWTTWCLLQPRRVCWGILWRMPRTVTEMYEVTERVDTLGSGYWGDVMYVSPHATPRRGVLAADITTEKVVSYRIEWR